MNIQYDDNRLIIHVYTSFLLRCQDLMPLYSKGENCLKPDLINIDTYQGSLNQLTVIACWMCDGGWWGIWGEKVVIQDSIRGKQ